MRKPDCTRVIEYTIITLMDWYAHTCHRIGSSDLAFHRYHVPSPQVQRQVVPDSVLINGVGNYEGGPETPSAVINVQPNTRYRFRLLEASQPIDNYWVHVDPNTGNTSTAILRYLGVPEDYPKDRTTPNQNPLNETFLHPLVNDSARLLQPEADVKLNLVLGKNESNCNFLINDVQYTSPSVPVLLQILSGAVSPSELEPKGSVYTLPKDKVIEISMPPDDAPGRPIRLLPHKPSAPELSLSSLASLPSTRCTLTQCRHSSPDLTGTPQTAQFAVIRSAGSSQYNYLNPVMRDTVTTGIAGDNVTIQFITDNPGPWMLHW
jgi:iron transport multicopper oxidase